MLLKQFSKFLLIGGISTGVNYGLFYLLLSASVHYTLASSLGYLLGLLLGYFLNKQWTFEMKHKNALSSCLKYGLVYASSLGFGLLMLQFMTEGLLWNVKIGNIGMLGFTTLSNFFGIKFWAFRDHLHD